MAITRKTSFALSLLTALFSLTAHPTRATAAVEIVQSAPVETVLAVPGIKTTQDAWLEMIRSARSSIDIEQFYISSQRGEALEPILAAIQEAAVKRSVKVRVLIDKTFYRNYPNDANALARISGIEVRTIDFTKQKGIMHAKYFIVDRNQAFVGSTNFDWLALSHIHEVGLHVTDAKIGADLESIFETDWAKGVSTGRSVLAVADDQDEPRNSGQFTEADSGLQVLASPQKDNPSGITETLPQLLGLIGAARSSLKIQVYQYSTKAYDGSGSWKALDSAIRAAAARGVSVQLLVDAVSMKSGGKDLSALAALKNIQVKKVVIPTWSGGVIPYARLIHSKYVVVDGARAWVGSENWSKDYFFSSRNVGLIVNVRDIAAGLTQIFNRVWSSPYASTVNQPPKSLVQYQP